MSIARESFLSRHGRPAGARSPVASVPRPNRNRNPTLNLSCFYTPRLCPIHPIPVPRDALKRFTLFPFFQLYFRFIATGPPCPTYCAKATCNQNNSPAISNPYQFRNTIFYFPTFL
jgi:hypothetical protein